MSSYYAEPSLVTAEYQFYNQYDVLIYREYSLIIRTDGPELMYHQEYIWPKSGDVVCPVWNDKPIGMYKSFGFHGFPHGTKYKDIEMYFVPETKNNWIVVKVPKSDIIIHHYGSYVKFSKGEIIFFGDLAGMKEQGFLPVDFGIK